MAAAIGTVIGITNHGLSDIAIGGGAYNVGMGGLGPIGMVGPTPVFPEPPDAWRSHTCPGTVIDIINKREYWKQQGPTLTVRNPDIEYMQRTLSNWK